jgi:class 3 adenylate cyclase
VRMGFGLHVGWAIEGTIGSVFKIDASYLSPNVNIAARLEAATKQYGVPLLFSGELYDIMSPAYQNISREIDIVTVKGSVKPMRFMTIDLNQEGLAEITDDPM